MIYKVEIWFDCPEDDCPNWISDAIASYPRPEEHEYKGILYNSYLDENDPASF